MGLVLRARLDGAMGTVAAVSPHVRTKRTTVEFPSLRS